MRVIVWYPMHCMQHKASIATSSLCHLATIISSTGVVTGSADETLAFVSSTCTNSTAIQGTVQMPKPGIADVVFRPDGRIVFVAGWDGVVRVYQYSKRVPVAYLRHHTKGVTALALRPNVPHTLVTASKDASVAVWTQAL